MNIEKERSSKTQQQHGGGEQAPKSASLFASKSLSEKGGKEAGYSNISPSGMPMELRLTSKCFVMWLLNGYGSKEKETIE